MSMGGWFLTRWSSRLQSVLRIVTGFLFMAHGTQKLFVVPAAEGATPAELLSVRGVAGILEVVGGLLFLAGWQTRLVAFILCGQMAVAYFWRHQPQGLLPIVNRGELAVLYCFVFLYFAAAGGGPWSLDALRRHEAPPSRDS
jgi:putative oxidoreductase